MNELGISQRELGKSLGMSSSYVNKLLMGKRTIELTEFLDLCAALQWDASEVLSKCGESI
jgi:DNA-binding Xre family transcriptional regulator